MSCADSEPARGEPRCLALANLDFEYELALGESYTARAPRPGFAWRDVLKLLPEARQAECLDESVLRRPEPGLSRWGSVEELVVWGVTGRTRRLAEALDLSSAFPEVEAVREVNDKRFSHRLEKEMGLALPYSGIVESTEQLMSFLKGCPYDWVLKDPFGFSARERMVGRVGTISESAFGWARGRFAKGWTLLFEPWVDQTRNFSTHFSIGRGGEVSYLGHCQLLCDAGGVHRGNRVVAGDAVPPKALEAGRRVAAEVAGRGYWGLMGIDAFTGVLGGEDILRPLVEINARCSFGRLTLALQDWIPGGWSYRWWHPRRADAWRVDGAGLLPLPEIGEGLIEEGMYALPLSVDPEQKSGTAVLLAPHESGLIKLESWLEVDAAAPTPEVHG